LKKETMATIIFNIFESQEAWPDDGNGNENFRTTGFVNDANAYVNEKLKEFINKHSQ